LAKVCSDERRGGRSPESEKKMIEKKRKLAKKSGSRGFRRSVLISRGA